jgi:apolipoprotein N-acyltransferase
MWRLILSLLIGSTLTLAFAPFGYSAFAIFPLVYLLWRVENASIRQAAQHGFAFGLGWFGSGVSWVWISIHTFGGTNHVIAYLVTALFVTYLALYPLLFALLLAAYQRIIQNARARYLLISPALFTGCELIRAHALSGFPWLLLGNTQIETPLKSWAPWVGEIGLSFLVMMLVGAAYLLLSRANKQHTRWAVLSIAGVCLPAFLVSGHLFTRPSASPLTVAAVQGNITQTQKWDPMAVLAHIKHYQSMSARLPPKTRLVVWPETAVQTLPGYIKPLYRQFEQQARRANQTWLVGSPLGSPSEYYNGLTMLGRYAGAYRKIHRVPFGEYIPAVPILNPLITALDIPASNTHAGSLDQPLLALGPLTINSVICYEIAFSKLVRQRTQGADFIVVLSDDSWYGHSVAQSQQLAITQMRALETQRSILTSTNNGRTALINPWGVIVKQLPSYETGILIAQLQPYQGITPFMRYGDLPLLLLIGALLCLPLTSHYRGRRKRY